MTSFASRGVEIMVKYAPWLKVNAISRQMAAVYFEFDIHTGSARFFCADLSTGI
jgi:hypothetical protein